MAVRIDDTNYSHNSDQLFLDVDHPAADIPRPVCSDLLNASVKSITKGPAKGGLIAEMVKWPVEIDVTNCTPVPQLAYELD
jgi:hypothetical protein